MVAQLDQTPENHKSLPALLASIVRESDVLSAALSKLASRDFEIVPDESPILKKPRETYNLDQMARVNAFLNICTSGGRLCPVCGGV